MALVQERMSPDDIPGAVHLDIYEFILFETPQPRSGLVPELAHALTHICTIVVSAPTA